jgi:hypothetical protein
VSDVWQFLEAIARTLMQPNLVEHLSKDIARMPRQQKEAVLVQLALLSDEAPRLAVMVRSGRSSQDES